MRRNQRTGFWIRAAVAAAATAGWAGAARAEPFDVRRVSADAGVVVHLDLDALRHTKLYEQAFAKAEGKAEIALPEPMSRIMDAAGVKERDVHDLTAYALEDFEKHLMFIIHADMDAIRVTETLKQLAGETTDAAHGDHKILRWGQGNDAGCAAFHGKGLVVVASSMPDMEKALDTLDGKAASVKPDSLLAGKTAALAPAADKPLVLVALANLDKMMAANKADAPAVLQKVTGGWVTLGATEADVVLRAAAVAIDAPAAEKLQQTVEGVRAMLTLAGDSRDEDLKPFMSALQNAKTSRTDREVSVEATLSLSKAVEMLKRVNVEAGPDKNAPGKQAVRLGVKIGDDKKTEDDAK